MTKGPGRKDAGASRGGDNAGASRRPREPAAMMRRVLLLATPALAQPWRPERPVEILVGFAPGGASDLDARSYAAAMERVLGASFVVTNRTGAGGEVALSALARARPDGLTLGLCNMPSLVTIPIERQAQFRLADFALLAGLVNDPSAMSVHAQSPFRTIEQVIARALAAPDTLTFASPGVGTDDHLQLHLLYALTGARITNVTYAGDAPMRTALLTREVDISGLNLGAAAANPDNTRILVQAGRARSRFAPGVPTFLERGFAIEMGSERGMLAPAATPEPILSRLREATAVVARDPAFLAQLAQRFTEPAFEPPTEWGNRLAQREREYRALWQNSPWNR